MFEGTPYPPSITSLLHLLSTCWSPPTYVVAAMKPITFTVLRSNSQLENWASGSSRGSPKAKLEHLVEDFAVNHPLQELVAKPPEETIVYFGLHHRPSRP